MATDEPEIAANSAHDSTPARPRPPYQWPIMVAAKWIIRFATPPVVRNVPARMKNGIDMISNFSMPVNSFSDTVTIGTVVMVNMNVMTDSRARSRSACR